MTNIIELMNKIPSLVHLDGSSDDEIAQAESELGIEFADEYKDYLKEFRLASWDGTELTGLSKMKRLNVVDATQRIKAKYTEIPHNLYIVEFLNVDDAIVWQSSNGRIYQSVLQYEPKMIANSLVDYLCTKEEVGEIVNA